MPRKKKSIKDEQTLKEEIEIGSSEEIKKQQERQARFIVIFLIFLFLSTISFIYFYKSTSKFTYQGLKFQKIKSDSGMYFYNTTLKFSRSDGQVEFVMYFRNNPKQLENIPINATIMFRRTAFVSFEPKISGCYGSNIPAVQLGQYLGALGIKTKGATTDENLSKEKEVDWKNCDNTANSTVIVLRQANETSIVQQGDCYILNIADCEVIPVTEKFLLETTIQMIKRTMQRNINVSK
ncbi:MAG: hypothetical protein V1660_03970 [archaeon]